MSRLKFLQKNLSPRPLRERLDGAALELYDGYATTIERSSPNFRVVVVK